MTFKQFFVGMITLHVYGAAIGFFCSVASASDLSKAKVEFRAPTNILTTITGVGIGVTGEIKGEIGEAAFELKKLDTGLDMRNGHMLEDLHAAEHPVAVLKWNGIVGDLTLNGITHMVAIEHQGNKYSFDLNLTDHGLKGRKYLKAGVGDKVSVTVTIP